MTPPILLSQAHGATVRQDRHETHALERELQRATPPRWLPRGVSLEAAVVLARWCSPYPATVPEPRVQTGRA